VSYYENGRFTLFYRISLFLDAAVFKFFYRQHSEAAERSGLKFIMSLIDSSIDPADLNMF
jgi:hypothetical protein